MIVADISDFQPGFDVDGYADAGHEFLILKASEGATWRSRYMPAWRERAHSRGLVVGMYHFLRANPAGVETRNFMEAIGSLRPGEVAICDFEADECTAGQAADWLSQVEQVTNRRPVLYSGSYFLAPRPTAALTRWPLWVAAYGRNDGAEHPWPQTDRWAPFQDGPGAPPHEGRTVGWQYTSQGHVAGYGGALDVSRFDLTTDDLRRLSGLDVAPVPDPDPLHLGGRLMLAIG